MRNLQVLRLGDYSYAGFEGFADEFFLPRFFELGQGRFAQGEQIFPRGTFFLG